jgi:hypothetical protein
MLIVFFSVIMGAMGLGQMFSVNPSFAAARVSGFQLQKVIDRVPKIDSNPNGVRSPIVGQVNFRNVRFTYAARPTDEVIRGINLEIAPGMVVGVVGHSGSGKSTLISLIERFYEIESGAILIDNIPLREYNLDYLRENIGLGNKRKEKTTKTLCFIDVLLLLCSVSQEPTLFDMTIAENIRFGKWDATPDEVILAAKKVRRQEASVVFFVCLKSCTRQTRIRSSRNFRTDTRQCADLEDICCPEARNSELQLLELCSKIPKSCFWTKLLQVWKTQFFFVSLIVLQALDAESEALVQEALHKLMQGRSTTKREIVWVF